MPTSTMHRSSRAARSTRYARRPAKKSKERQLQCFVMGILGLEEADVLYEPRDLDLGNGKICRFDLEIRSLNLFLERTQADTYALYPDDRRRAPALRALARKYLQAQIYEELNPGQRVIVVTDAVMSLWLQNPSRFLSCLGLPKTLKAVA